MRPNPHREAVAILITTCNRRDELLRTLEILRALDPAPKDIIVTADNCTDDTVEQLRLLYPEVTLYSNEHGRGSTASRDAMLRGCTSTYSLLLDDDSAPCDAAFLKTLVACFEEHPEAAVIACHELRHDRKASLATPSRGRYVSTYANCAAAMRMSVFSDSRGFPLMFEHMYEEPDYALQCYSLGKAVWYEPSLVVHHRVSQSNRNELRNQFLNSRNQIWSAWLRCPLPYVVPVTLFRALRYVASVVRPSRESLGIIMSWPLTVARGLPQCLKDRHPVDWSTYWLWFAMPRRGRTATKEEIRCR